MHTQLFMSRSTEPAPVPKESAEKKRPFDATRETIALVLKKARRVDAKRRGDTWVGMPVAAETPGGREGLARGAREFAWARHGVTLPPAVGTPRRDVYGNPLQ